MKKNQCKEGLDIYKKFLTRMTRISEFLKVAEVKYLQGTVPPTCIFLFCLYAWVFEEITYYPNEVNIFNIVTYLVILICCIELCTIYL